MPPRVLAAGAHGLPIKVPCFYRRLAWLGALCGAPATGPLLWDLYFVGDWGGGVSLPTLPSSVGPFPGVSTPTGLPVPSASAFLGRGMGYL